MDIEVITGAARRRYWTREQKEAILRAAFAPEAVVKVVARQHDIGTGLLYTWRKQLCKVRPGVSFSRLLAVADPLSAPPAADTVAIEIDIGGSKIRIPSSMPLALAAAVIAALVKR